MKDGGVKAMEVALLALDIAKACQAIHKHNIIHGDLKPHNVLLTQEAEDERGWIGKIADFGLSVKIKRGEQHVSGIQHGTEGYVAPGTLPRPVTAPPAQPAWPLVAALVQPCLEVWLCGTWRS